MSVLNIIIVYSVQLLYFIRYLCKIIYNTLKIQLQSVIQKILYLLNNEHNPQLNSIGFAANLFNCSWIMALSFEDYALRKRMFIQILC